MKLPRKAPGFWNKLKTAFQIEMNKIKIRSELLGHCDEILFII